MAVLENVLVDETLTEVRCGRSVDGPLTWPFLYCLTRDRSPDKYDQIHRFTESLQPLTKLDADKEVPVRDESPPHAHLRPPRPPVDLTCPSLMLAANASLILGYLWVGWLSDGSRSGLVLASIRGGVLPVLVALAIFAIRLLCVRRGLPGGTLLLPVAATVELGVAIAAEVSGSAFLAMTAGGAALFVALLAIASVLRRETRAVRRWPASPTSAPTSRVSGLSLRSSALNGTCDQAEQPAKVRHLVMR